MINYEKLYLTLLNGITDAVHSIEKQNYGSAKECLIVLQQKVEDIFIEAGENENQENVSSFEGT